MQPVLLVDVVGLTQRQIGEHTPHLARLAREGACAPMDGVLPAVTLSAQATMLTGRMPAQHGAVGNGWFDRESGEVAFWRQSNALVQGEKLYQTARRREPAFTCAKLFWWWNMGAEVDWSVTPRPFYPADGRKLLAVYGRPNSYVIDLEQALGPFPFFDFWGPRAGLPSSRWIADATLRTLERERPTLTLSYLPHLDYDHQRLGPRAAPSLAALREVDALVGELAEAAERHGAALVVVSEYGLCEVERAVHVNRALRREGLLEVRETPVGEVLDTFASRAFAVSDHQVAHVYARTGEALEHARRVLRNLDGVADVLDRAGQRKFGIDHPRAGDLVAVADAKSWFTYYYWLDDERAPDFARTVDIHRKPGYDPCELLLDIELALPKLRVALRLAQKALGQRMLMDVIGLDASVVRGSHGRLADDPLDGPVFLCSRPFEEAGGAPAGGLLRMASVRERVLKLLFPSPE
ncbi:MAG TPA: alkaline phosphatase family protein [Planctomycetota bacterium]|nr:alkaline phosphatase family protein [Planctomycetota bacterium]